MLFNAITNERSTPLVNEGFYDLVMENKEEIESVIDYHRDYDFDFFGLKTLEKSYLYKVNKVIVERPQDMIMRVSLSIHRNDLGKAFETYRLIRKQKRGEVIKDLKSFSGKISNILKNGDYLMIKGSNATGLHMVSKDFIGRGN